MAEISLPLLAHPESDGSGSYQGALVLGPVGSAPFGTTVYTETPIESYVSLPLVLSPL